MNTQSTMTGPQFRAALKALNLKPGAFGVWVGVHRVTVHAWMRDEPPLYAARGVGLLLERQNLGQRLAALPE